MLVWTAWNGNPAKDLATEDLLLERAALGEPCLFAYGWASPVLVLGYGQDTTGISLPACRKDGVAILRRLTGGTGVLYTGDLALSLALPAHHPWAASIGALYEAFVGSLRGGLATLGLETVRGEGRPAAGARSPICFEEHASETLLLAGRKVLGCAQTRRREAVLVHGALLLSVDAPLQARVYGVPEERIERLLGCVPGKACGTRESLAEVLAEHIARNLDEKASQPLAPPLLTPELTARLTDPKWVLARA